MHTAPPSWGPHPRCPRWAPNAATQTNFPRQQSEGHPRLSSHSHGKPREISNKRHPPSTSWGQGSYSVVPSVLARAPAQRSPSHSSALRAASGQQGQCKHTTPSKKTPYTHLHPRACCSFSQLWDVWMPPKTIAAALKSFPRRGPPGLHSLAPSSRPAHP